MIRLGYQTKADDGHTDCEQLPNFGLAPLHEVTTFSAAHIKNFATSSTGAGGTLCEGWMSELRNKNRFYPIVEILESNNLGLPALFHADFRSQIILGSGVKD